MELYKSLGLDLNKKQVISIVGGGGKTTTMNKLATELKEKGKKVLVTTSTCMMMPKEEEYDRIIKLEDIKKNEEIMKKNLQQGSITVIFGEILRIDKIKGLEEETIDYIFNEDIFDSKIVAYS